MIEIRCKRCNKLLGKIEKAEKCSIEFKCEKCKLQQKHNIENV